MTDETPTLLIVEDDESFSRTLRKSFERRGYMVVSADGPDQMAEVLKIHRPGFAVVDLKLGGASGLGCSAPGGHHAIFTFPASAEMIFLLRV